MSSYLLDTTLDCVTFAGLLKVAVFQSFNLRASPPHANG